MKHKEWLEKAVGKDDRLNRVHVEDGISVSTDGHRLHAVNQGKRFTGYQNMIRGLATNSFSESVIVDIRLLKEALPESGPVRLVVHPGLKMLELFFEDGDEVSMYAVVMGMQPADPNMLTWRPLPEYSSADEEEE